MSSNRNGSETTEDWLSAPVGARRSSGTATPTNGVPDADRRNGNGKAPAKERSANGAPTATYAGSARTPAPALLGDSTEQYDGAGLYPASYRSEGGVSPAASAPLSAGPATSIGLGSSATGTSTTTAAPAAKSGSGRRPARGPRRAKLQIRHLDPWSTLKLSLVLAIALFFVWMVAVGVLYGVLNGMGVFDKINSLFSEIATSSDGTKSGPLITTKVVFGGAALIGAINIVLFTALATIGSYIYNLCADLVGGLEITLAERR